MSLVKSWMHPIAVVAFVASANLPYFVAPAIAAPPALTVTKITSTPTTNAGSAATYTITVRNAVGADTASQVNITDSLPRGFSFDATVGIPALSGAATRTSVSNPTLGAQSPAWGAFSIPGGGAVSITFTANIGDIAPRLYNNSVSVAYTDPANQAGTASYTGTASNTEDVTVSNPPVQPPSTTTPPTPPVGNAVICGSPGRDGIGNLTGIVNTYFPGLSAVVNAGSNSIALGAGQGAGNQIDIGDLLLVIQMQDASINSTNSASYGSGNSANNGSGQTSMGQSGLYEYVVATSNVPVSGGTLTFSGKGAGNGLIYKYVNAAATASKGQSRFQIVRVPQYASVSLSNTLRSLQWNGTVGGVMALDVVGQLNLNNRTIDSVFAGFRAGYTNIHSSGSSVYNYVGLISNAANLGSGKGEGTAGTPQFVWNGTTAVNNGSAGYPDGDVGRGAPSNAGGGGNTHNAGGGGGGNGGIGGNGGLPWEGSAGPLNVGGRPGFQSSLYTPTPTLLLMGGGGGGGDANNATSGVRGGVGGGITIIRAGGIAGNGTILANGDDGDRGAQGSAPDGAGGGGAGGTVLIAARNASSTANISIQANGGKGGNTAGDAGNEHGPGGGGGGGVVLYNLPGGTINASVSGGLSGKANDGAGISHGAADGTVGQTQAFSTNEDPFSGVNGDGCLPVLSVTKVTSTPKSKRGGIANYTISVTNATGKGSATGVNISDTLPSQFTYLSTDNITLTGGAARTSATNPAPGSPVPVWDAFTIPGDGKVQITFQVQLDSTVPIGTYQNPATAQYPDPARIVPNGITQADYIATSSSDEDVTVSSASVELVKRITAINGDRTKNPNDNTPLDVFVNDTNPGDNASNWPNPTSGTPPISTFLRGAIDAGKVKSGDTIEYTIYFLNVDFGDASSVRICDRLTSSQTFLSGAYGTNKDIQLHKGDGAFTTWSSANISNLTSVFDEAPASGDRAQLFSSSSSAPSTCNLQPVAPGVADRGTLMVDVTGMGNLNQPDWNFLSGSNGPGTANSYGFIRFTTKVNP